MPIKFSQFTNRTSDTATTTIVGFDGNQNIKILSSDLLSGFINGTADTIPVFATANTLGDSIITQDNPATTVTIAGALSVTSDTTVDGRVTSRGITVTEPIVLDNTEIQFNQPSDLAENTFVGTGAGNVGTSVGPFNVALGNGALSSATTSSRCVAIGHDALVNDTIGNKNIAIGDLSLQGNTTGSKNIAIGTDTLKTKAGSSKNIAIGDQSMRDGASGNNNVGIGADTLLQNTASFNVGIGYNSLSSNTSGVSNTAVGANTLPQTIGNTARRNTAIGQGAGVSITTGQNNTLLGYNAQASTATTDNEITLGDANVSVLRCAVTTITSLSDERDKTDITNLEYGLDFINSLSPKQFTWNQRPEYAIEIDDDGNEAQVEVENANRGKKDFGFIAQEVQSVDNDILRLVYAENPEKLEMSYGKLVPILVKAIKELTARVEALEA